jgi:hypothetical protein
MVFKNVQAHANIPPGYAVGRLQSLEPAENHESVSRGTLVIEVCTVTLGYPVPTFAIICLSSRTLPQELS